MLEFDVVVRLDGHWVQLPVTGEDDGAVWARQVVAERVGAVDGRLAPVVRAWADVLEGLRRRVDGQDAAMVAAYGLVPPGDLLPVTVAELHATLLDGRGLDGLVDDLVLPEAGRFGPPEVDQVSTAAGEAVRVRQLPVVTGTGGGQSVATSVVHVFEGPHDGTALVLTAYFGSPMDAEAHVPVLDALAASVTYAGAS